ACEAFGRISRTHRRPEAMWHYERMVALRAIHAGDFEQAEARFHDLFVQGRRLRLPYATLHAMMHSCAMAYERFGLEALGTAMARQELDWAAEIPSFRAHWVRFLMEIRTLDDARQAFDAMAKDGFSTITKDIGYLNALAHLSLVAEALGDA